MDRWTTEDELNYLRHIGNFAATGEPRTSLRKIGLLRNYILAARMRMDWAGMDKGRIIKAARNDLYKLELQVG